MDMIESIYDPEFFRRAGHELVDRLADYVTVANMGKMPVLPKPDPPPLAEHYEQPLTVEPATDVMKVLSFQLQELIGLGIHLQHQSAAGIALRGHSWATGYRQRDGQHR